MKSLLTLQHDNIISLDKVFEDADWVHLVFPLIKGQDLHSFIQRQNDIEESKITAIFKQLADILTYLKRKGIVHRDIKPENIMLTKENQLILLDFGFSTSDDSQCDLVVGSLDYMSPEMLNGSGAQGSTDVWAAGVVLFNLLTGKQPFSGEEEIHVRKSILGDEPNLEYICSEYSAEIIDLVCGMLEKDTDKRFNIEEVRNHLCLGGELVFDRNNLNNKKWENPFEVRAPDSEREQTREGTLFSHNRLS